jgi:anti-anti-sigma regulatory factor
MPNFECIELESVDDISVVKFKDEKVIDPSRIETMGQELLSLVDDAAGASDEKSLGDDAGKRDEQSDQSNVLVNFENVRFFSSGAINKLIVLEKRVRARGGKICLSNLRPEVRDLFSYTNLDSMFEICIGQAEAIEAFND